ncbi:MAG: RodZ domain-containing protein [Pseudomonadota bacterium]
MTPELTQEQQGVETAPSSPSPESTRSTPGQLIRRARERARMTTEELSAMIKLARGTLDALERDDFKVLMEPVYVRGYYRKCAKVLGIAESDLVDAYQAMVAPRAPEAPAKLRLASGSELGSGSRLPLALASAAAGIGVVVLSIIWFARGEVTQVPELPAVVEAPVENKAAVPVDVTTLATDVAATPDATGATPAAVPTTPATDVTAATQPQAVAPVTPTPLVPAATGVSTVAVPTTKPLAGLPVAVGPMTTGTLTLRFNITSWARVEDATGKTLVNGLIRAGEKQSWTGHAPFSVFLGNAPGVSADFNGRLIDLTKITAQNNTARFSAGANTP